jgi:hypothetical protein
MFSPAVEITAPPQLRSGRTQAFATWADVTGAAMVAQSPLSPGIAQPIPLSVNLQMPG